MKLSNELIKQTKQCKSAEEIQALAKQHGVELSEKEVAEAFARLHKNGELSDSELSGVSAGVLDVTCDSSGTSAKYKLGDRVKYYDYKDTNPDSDSFDATGTVTRISDKRDGSFHPEWIYTIRSDDGGKVTSVYEHQIYGKI